MKRERMINAAVFLIAASLIFFLSMIPQTSLSPMASWWFYDMFMITLSTLFWTMLAGSSFVLAWTLFWLLRRTDINIGKGLPAAFAFFFAALSILAVVHALIIWVPLYWLAIGIQGFTAMFATATAIATRMRRHELANLLQKILFRGSS